MDDTPQEDSGNHFIEIQAHPWTDDGLEADISIQILDSSDKGLDTAKKIIQAIYDVLKERDPNMTPLRIVDGHEGEPI